LKKISRSRLLFHLLTLIAGISIGWWFGARHQEFAATVPARLVEVASPVQPVVLPVADILSLRQAPASHSRNRDLVEALAQLAAKDPLQAIALAQAERNRALRRDLVRAVLKAWARFAPDPAAAWAEQQNTGNRSWTMEAVFSGYSVEHPADCVLFAKRLFSREPVIEREYGRLLVEALTDAGRYQIAADFAQTENTEAHLDWLATAFTEWAAQRPEEAARAAALIADPRMRRTSVQAVYSSWAQNDSPGLANYALTLAAGEDRSFVLKEALRNWVADSSIDAAQWISQQTLSEDFDEGISSVVRLPVLANQPQVAMDWAANITQPQKRQQMYSTILEDWLRKDAGAARTFVESSPDLNDEERRLLSQDFQPQQVENSD
jgi:hypothetical protein